TLVVEFSDTSSRARLRALLGTRVTFRNGARPTQAMEDRPRVPQCSSCLRWGHPQALCRAHSAACELCGEPHDVRHHRTLASCCRGSDAPSCGHPPRCINCGQAHRATARECPYYLHRHDMSW
ncbi:hypothetical protein C8Q80DRAFT_1078669, partial [Daedaleopsis nitida]